MTDLLLCPCKCASGLRYQHNMIFSKNPAQNAIFTTGLHACNVMADVLKIHWMQNDIRVNHRQNLSSGKQKHDHTMSKQVGGQLGRRLGRQQ